MAKAARRPSDRPALPMFGQLEGLAAFNGATVGTLMKAGSTYWGAMTEVNSELSRFFTNRLSHDVEFGESVARCDNWERAVSLQQDWARTAMEEYAAEATKLMQLSANASMEGWRQFYGEASLGARVLSREASETQEQ